MGGFLLLSIFIFSSCFFFKSIVTVFYVVMFYMVVTNCIFCFMLIFNFNVIQSSFCLNYFIDIDCISFALILLVLIVFPLCLVYNFFKINFSFRFYTVLLLVLYMLLLISFCVNDFFLFYLFFEAILIPMSLIVGVWGSRGRKLHASYLFFFYTFVSSVFLLLGLFFLFFDFGTLSFLFIKLSLFSSNDIEFLVLFFFFIGFVVKIPCFPVHIWLPEAHVEAPTVGSVILASLLLKLGYYGLLRILISVPGSFVYFTIKPFFCLVFLISLIYSSCTAICQIDLKKIVAYSSIVHMNFAMLGFLSSDIGLIGSLFLMVSHGLISSALFFCVGFLYDRFGTRNLVYYGGLFQHMPIFSIFYFIFIFSNMSLPGTCNFIGEILVFFSIFNYSFSILFFTVFSVFCTSVFCLILLNRVVFFQFTGFLRFNLNDLTVSEFFILFILVFYIVLFGLIPNLILSFFSLFVF